MGHIAYALVACGTLAVARGRWWGWMLRAWGDALWILLGFKLGLTSIWGWEIVFISQDLYALYLWRKK